MVLLAVLVLVVPSNVPSLGAYWAAPAAAASKAPQSSLWQVDVLAAMEVAALEPLVLSTDPPPGTDPNILAVSAAAALAAARAAVVAVAVAALVLMVLALTMVAVVAVRVDAGSCLHGHHRQHNIQLLGRPDERHILGVRHQKPLQR